MTKYIADKFHAMKPELTFTSLLLFAVLTLLQRNTVQADGPAGVQSLRVMTYNTYLMQVDGAPDRQQRGKAIGDAKMLQGFDVVVLNELFDPGPSQTLLKGLSKEYPHQTPTVGASKRDNWDATEGSFSNSLAVIRGGVAVVSKWPVERQVQYIFKDAGGWDYNANKGFAYVRIRYKGQRIHIIGTHTNASGSGGLAGISQPRPGYASGWKERQSQFREITAFINRQKIPTSELVLIMGDLNVIRKTGDGRPTREYVDMLKLLNAAEPLYSGVATWHPESNPLIKEKDLAPQWLDYILVVQSHKPAARMINTVLKNDQNLSDHFPAMGQFQK